MVQLKFVTIYVTEIVNHIVTSGASVTSGAPTSAKFRGGCIGNQD